MPRYRIDFHNHCQGDPVDALGYTALELIDAFHRAGVHAVAITPHGRVFQDPAAEAHARTRGMLLISGVEKMVSGRELVLLNVTPEDIPRRMDWDALRALRTRRGPDVFVLAPHPWYPRVTCAGPEMDAHADCIDGVEWCHLFGLGFDPNRRAAAWAEAHHKPFLTTSDAHALHGVARNTTEVEADALTPRALFDALRARRLRASARPYSVADCAAFGFRVVLPNQVRGLLQAAGIRR